MKNIPLNNSSYELVSGYQDNAEKRRAFNDLVTQVFGFSFESWYQQGYWTNKYIPYTLFDDKSAIANVSVNTIEFKLNSVASLHTVQIGTVLTEPSFRNQGLCQALMNIVIQEWQNKCDLLYLFANASSIQLYPKLGFIPVTEYEHHLMTPSHKIHPRETSHALDMTNRDNKVLVFEKAKIGNPYALLSLIDNPGLIMFYCTSIMSDCIYYLERQDLIVIAQLEGDTLCIYDILGDCHEDLNTIIDIFCLEYGNPANIRLGFTPNHLSQSVIRKRDSEDVLFILNGNINIFEQQQMMFPVLSHA